MVTTDCSRGRPVTDWRQTVRILVRSSALAVAGAAIQSTPLVRIRILPTGCPRHDHRRFDQRHRLTAKLRKPHRPNNRLCLLA